ncbi:MAG: PDZ domain-containing protein [Armatimonadota bacterium]|nr:PDZ domain-containing protein [Armatimonadota bacterium]
MLLIATLALAGQQNPAFDPGSNPLLLQHPTVSESRIVFQFAGDLWSVAREGGSAGRLTSSPGIEGAPHFSPDGAQVAFTGQYDGNTDVFVVPASGGVPKRLTYHPAGDQVAGWTNDGKSIVFASSMLSNTGSPRLFTVGTGGGVPRALPFPEGTMASFSPDGQKLAYVPGFKWQDAWKRYRGGQAYAIWIGQMSDSKVHEIPRKGWNDFNPMWVNNKVFYLSDPKGPVGLFSYDVNTKRVAEEVPGNGFDLKSASAGPGAIVYEKLGGIYLFDLGTRKANRVPIEVHGDFPEVRPAFKSVAGNITSANISPTGQRAVVAARGWIFTVPAEKGDGRLLNDKQGVHRREPAWSPDAKTIAYITDQNGRQQMSLFDVAANTEKFIELGDSPAYYFSPTWSPDSKMISYTDNRNKLWVLDVATGKNAFVDSSTYTDPFVSMNARWSPDSKWMTWARDLDSHMQAIYVYDVEGAKVSRITDGLANAKSPIFDRDGKHLYFYASTNLGPAVSWLDMSSFTNQAVTSSVYCVVLRNDLPNPLHPESDEEPIKETPPPVDPEKPVEPPKKPEEPKFRIDLENIAHRIISLPMGAANYMGLEAGPAGTFFAVVGSGSGIFSAASSIVKFDMSERKSAPFTAGGGIVTTADGKKALLLRPGGAAIISTIAPPPPGGPGLDLSDLKVKIDPKVEWASIFHEIWRNEPMLFYAANLHGVDAEAMRKRYEPFLAGVASRDDLNYLFTDMLGEIVIGHMWAFGGDIPDISGVPGGLLGADYSFENGKYKITRVYDGERWNPGLMAPLAQPGINAKAGEYVLAIDGKDLKDSNDIYEKLEGKSGKQVKVKIGSNADGTGSREVVVVPVASEFNLRNKAWAEDNRRYVEKMTDGRAGYVHVPDTGGGGWTSFLRYYYAQTDKDGMIVDERFNGGGLINDFMVYEMTKTLDAAFTPRDGKDWPTPGNAIYGPKVMIVNQFAGSGGDMFPWLFKHKKIGPVVGKRTWGGLVASFGFATVDGGGINAPNCAFYNPASGKWEVEGYGVDPDIDVELDPYLWRQGKDAQLERAIEEMNKSLKSYKRPELKRPTNPDKTKIGGRN